jgi:hypothetical protein
MSERFKSRTAVVTAAGAGIGAALVADGGLTAQTGLPPFVPR